MKYHKYRAANFFSAFIFAVVILGVWARFFDLGSQSLWSDEGYTLWLTDGESASGTARLLLESSVTNWYLTPAYFFMLSFWRGVFGSSEIALRSLSAIVGSMALLTVIVASWRAWGRTWACWTAVFAAVSGYSVYYSQEIRPYALLILTTSLVLAAYLECKDPRRADPRPAARIALVVAAFVAVWSSAMSAFFLVALALNDLLFSRSFGRWFKLWLPPALAAATFALWIGAHFLVAEGTTQSVLGADVPFVLRAGFITTGISVGTTFGPPLADLRGSDRVQVLLEYAPQYALLALSLAVIGGLLLIAGWMSWRSRRAAATRGVRLPVLIGSAILLFAIILALELPEGVHMNPRHAFALWPLICLTLPAVVLFPGFADKRWVRWTGGLAFGLLVMLNSISLFNYFTDENYWRDNYRLVGEYVDRYKNFRPVLLSGDPTALEYYSDQKVIDKRGPVHKLRGLLNDHAADWPGLIVVINRPFNYPYDAGERTIETLKPEFTLVEKTFPHYFEVYRFERADKGGQ